MIISQTYTKITLIGNTFAAQNNQILFGGRALPGSARKLKRFPRPSIPWPGGEEWE